MSRFAMPPDMAITDALARSARRNWTSDSSAAARALSGAHPEKAAVVVQVLPDGQGSIQVVGLCHDADHLLGQRRMSDHVDAGHDGFAARRDDQGGEHADGSRLARAVGAEQPEDLSPVHRQVKPVHGQDVARVALGQLLAADDLVNCGTIAEHIGGIGMRRHVSPVCSLVPKYILNRHYNILKD